MRAVLVVLLLVVGIGRAEVKDGLLLSPVKTGEAGKLFGDGRVVEVIDGSNVVVDFYFPVPVDRNGSDKPVRVLVKNYDTKDVTDNTRISLNVAVKVTGTEKVSGQTMFVLSVEKK